MISEILLTFAVALLILVLHGLDVTRKRVALEVETAQAWMSYWNDIYIDLVDRVVDSPAFAERDHLVYLKRRWGQQSPLRCRTSLHAPRPR